MAYPNPWDDQHFARRAEEHTRALLAQPLDAHEAIDLVREMLRSSAEHFLTRPLDLLTHLVHMQNRVREQANELGEMRAREKERGSELERRQAREIMDLRAALELARGVANARGREVERLRGAR